MNLRMVLLLGCASIMAAAGQMFLKAGATGNVELIQYFNWKVLTGLVLYALGTVIWIYGLSVAPLVAVYSFAALTFVFVYAGSVAFLGERVSLGALAGCSFIVVGLVMLLRASR
jgi:drug/metabolite transporter (DMT)-like permease